MREPITRTMAVVLLATCGACSGRCIRGSAGPGDDPGWHVVASGSLARASVERVLYRREGAPHFFMRVRIESLAARPLSVDLTSASEVIYPNQWGVLQDDERAIIDEERREFAAPGAAASTAIREAHAQGALPVVEPRGTLDYFCEFNASSPGDVDAQIAALSDARFVFVSMDGRLLLTDGDTVEQISCTWWEESREPESTTVIIPLPLEWHAVPDEALLLLDDWTRRRMPR